MCFDFGSIVLQGLLRDNVCRWESSDCDIALEGMMVEVKLIQVMTCTYKEMRWTTLTILLDIREWSC